MSLCNSGFFAISHEKPCHSPFGRKAHLYLVQLHPETAHFSIFSALQIINIGRPNLKKVITKASAQRASRHSATRPQMDDHDGPSSLIDLTGTARGLQSPATGKQHMTSNGVKRTPPPFVRFGKQSGSPTDFSGISDSR